MVSWSNGLVEGDSGWDKVDSLVKSVFLLTTTSDFIIVTGEILPNIFTVGSTSLEGTLAKITTLVIGPQRENLIPCHRELFD